MQLRPVDNKSEFLTPVLDPRLRGDDVGEKHVQCNELDKWKTKLIITPTLKNSAITLHPPLVSAPGETARRKN
jgi:hypothetical protein